MISLETFKKLEKALEEAIPEAHKISHIRSMMLTGVLITIREWINDFEEYLK